MDNSQMVFCKIEDIQIMNRQLEDLIESVEIEDREDCEDCEYSDSSDSDDSDSDIEICYLGDFNYVDSINK